MRLSIATKVFLGFAAVLATSALVSVFGIVQSDTPGIKQLFTELASVMSGIGHPDAAATSYTHTEGSTGKQWTAVRAFTAHGAYVFLQLGQAVDGLTPAIGLVAKAIDDDVASRGGESFGRGKAETLRRSRDEHAFALKHGSRLPL